MDAYEFKFKIKITDTEQIEGKYSVVHENYFDARERLRTLLRDAFGVESPEIELEDAFIQSWNEAFYRHVSA